MSVNRRDFLSDFVRLAGCFAVTAGAVPLSSCKTLSSGKSSDQFGFTFPQGVASGDPQADAVVLWTRVEATLSTVRAKTKLTAQVALDDQFAQVVVERGLVVDDRSDHTVSIFVDGLDPDSFYWYRFIAEDDSVSPTGRTRTAPTEKTIKPVNFAVLSCQHFESGFFTAYRQLIVDDRNARPDRKIDFILHLGDFIYENNNARPVINHKTGERLTNLLDVNGKKRVVKPYPSGGSDASTLEDYRHIYKIYLSDPDLQAARAAFPFVCVWDDHEVLNDYWQSYHGDRPIQQLKMLANQAWSEFIPSALSRAAIGASGTNPAKDFIRSQTENSPASEFDDHYLSLEPNNLAAINSMTIYRTLRWGALANFFLLDTRSYRGLRGITEELLDGGEIAYPEEPLDPDLVRTLNAGRFANDGTPPPVIQFQGRSMPNPRRNSPLGSMLGAKQKDWLKSELSSSSAQWDLVCTSVPFARIGFDTSFRPGGFVNAIEYTDGWDGYPIERDEIMNFVAEIGKSNVVSIAGDRHAHFAGYVYDSYDSERNRIVMPEFTVAGVSASSRFYIQARVEKDPEFRARTLFDGTGTRFNSPFVPAMNAWILHGAAAAKRLSESADPDEALKVAQQGRNDHLVYADTDAYGYLLAHFGVDSAELNFVTVSQPIQGDYNDQRDLLRRIKMSLGGPTITSKNLISAISVTGDPPLLGVRISKT